MRLLLLLSFLFLYGFGFSQTPLVDSLKKAIESGIDFPQRMRAYQALIGEYSRTNLSRAKSLAHEGISKASEANHTLSLSGFYSQLSSLHQNTGQLDSMEIYLDAIEKLSHRVQGKEKEQVLANYHSARGLSYKRLGNYKAAIPSLLKAAELAKRISTTESAAGQYLNIGNTYMNIGAYGKALQYHLESLRLFEQTGSKKGQSFCYQGICEDFIELKNYRKALEYVKKSLALKTELADKRGVGNAYSSMGRIYLGLKKYNEAHAAISRSLSIAKELQLKAEEAKQLLSLGRLFAEKKVVTTALDYFTSGRNLALEAGDSASVVLANREMATLQNITKEQELAEKRLLGNIHSLKANGNKKEEIFIYNTLAELYAQTGEPEKSLQYKEMYYQGKDSMLSKDIQLEISRLEEQYKSEKKEAEIALLKKDQQIIQSELKRQKQSYYAVIVVASLLLLLALLLVNRYKVVHRARRQVEMEKMRNHIAKDLHDDIGSTLSSINILSRVLLQQAKTGVTDFAGLQKIKEHSSAIMDSMSDIVWAINPQNDTAEKMLYKMKEFAAEILDPLNIQYNFIEKGDFANLKLDPRKRRDLFLIFKESINNAAKYSKCQNIAIRLTIEGNAIQMHVTDDGEGFDQQTVKKGNGLINLQERSQAVGGRLRCISQTGSGTSVQLDLPIT
jgi:signal transduction histidine kinase